MFQWERCCNLLLGNGVPAMAGHLTLEERDRIAQLRHQHANRKEIAHALGRSPATIGREQLRPQRHGRELLCRPGATRVRAAAARASPHAEDGRSPKSTTPFAPDWRQEWARGADRGPVEHSRKTTVRFRRKRSMPGSQRDEDRKHWESMLRRRGKRRWQLEKHGSDGRRRPHSQSSGGHHRGAAAAGRL